jgi:hypothetical protein
VIVPGQLGTMPMDALGDSKSAGRDAPASDGVSSGFSHHSLSTDVPGALGFTALHLFKGAIHLQDQGQALG